MQELALVRVGETNVSYFNYDNDLTECSYMSIPSVYYYIVCNLQSLYADSGTKLGKSWCLSPCHVFNYFFGFYFITNLHTNLPVNFKHEGEPRIRDRGGNL